MGRKSKTGRGEQKGQGTVANGGKQIVPQSADAKKTRNINVLQGIAPLELSQAGIDHTPIRRNLISRDENCLAQSSGKSSWADMVEEEVAEEAGLGKSQNSMNSWSKVIGPIPTTEGFDLCREEVIGQNVKITIDDIKDEVEYCSSAVICYVLGSNPPLSVMDGYFRIIWGNMGIDKVTLVNKGVFLVRFQTEESEIKTVEEGVQDIGMKKETINRIPIWIKLMGLDIKYWGKSSLTKIAGMAGKPLKANRATTQKEQLTFARILIEMSINQQYPSRIMFENEYEKIIEQ
ncbi:uncharacterized protein [Nicotiana sylvestris]|uniref:DUF4283 domain-containing protein n=2 Tax=Nicotiana TaxID=4085 RepID=A0A1S4B0U1_TOBAC|nr:PREDICTED: uncharacterized protein LOC104234280 [Nicotiana sylvestris]XP_016482459.1 PREDICTED: uncharacterized protein LOC107803286 [Nicotiana tabacum]